VKSVLAAGAGIVPMSKLAVETKKALRKDPTAPDGLARFEINQPHPVSIHAEILRYISVRQPEG
jgi:hypothetical protein